MGEFNIELRIFIYDTCIKTDCGKHFREDSQYLVYLLKNNKGIHLKDERYWLITEHE